MKPEAHQEFSASHKEFKIAQFYFSIMSHSADVERICFLMQPQVGLKKEAIFLSNQFSIYQHSSMILMMCHATNFTVFTIAEYSWINQK